MYPPIIQSQADKLIPTRDELRNHWTEDSLTEHHLGHAGGNGLQYFQELIARNRQRQLEAQAAIKSFHKAIEKGPRDAAGALTPAQKKLLAALTQDLEAAQKAVAHAAKRLSEYY